MADRPNILFLTHRVPHPPNRGDRIRSWNMLRHLATQANMHLACLTDEPVSENSSRELHRVCQRVEIQPLSNPGRWLHGGWSLLTGGSATEGLFRSDKLGATIRQWAKETCFDAALVFCSSMYQFAKCNDLGHVPVVVDLVDVDSEKWLNYAENASFFKRCLYHLEAKRVRQLEIEIAEQAKAVTLVSENEVKVFREFCDVGNVHAISNGVDLDYFHPAPNEYEEQQRGQSHPKPFKLVFVGVLDYRANIEGLRWFCREVWPGARQQIPNIQLDLVGRRPSEAARQLAALPGINLIGEVEDVRPFVWKADAVIAPLTIARGIQNKVLEAMAMGKPVIATPQAIEGTGAVPGEHVLSGEDSEQWIANIKESRDDTPRRNSLAVAARRDAEMRFSWSNRLHNLCELLNLYEVDLTGKSQNSRRERFMTNC